MCERPQRREDEVLDPGRRGSDAAFVPEVPEGGAELEDVPGRAPGRGGEVGDQAGEGLMPFLRAQGGTELDDALDVGGSRVAFGVGHQKVQIGVSSRLAVMLGMSLRPCPAHSSTGST